MYQVQKQKGITLIALVITVIVLIILAGVGINLTLGENGILRRAQDAQKLSDKATVKEKVEVAIVEVQVEEVTSTGSLTLQKIYETLESKDSYITLNEYTEGETELTGTYTLNGKTYSFTIDDKFKVEVGDEGEVAAKPIKFGELVWNADGTVSVNATTDLAGNIEYQVNGTDGEWQTGALPTNLQHGDKLYVRVNDGTTTTEPQEIEIKDTILPEEFTISVPEDTITYEELKITSTGTTDNQTGIKDYSFIVTKDGTVVKSITEQDVTEYEITGLTAETEYVVYMLAYDKAGNARKSNEVTVTTKPMPVAKMFGQYVDYPVDIDGNEDDYDWQIFYIEDGTNNPDYKGATYIIPDYYVPVSKLKTIMSNTGMSSYEGTYRIRWYQPPSYKTISDDVKSIFMYDYTQTGNANVNCVSRLLDNSVWKDDFVTSQLEAKGGIAIGSPTIKMWCASWNKAYPTQDEMLTPTISGTGYQVNNSKDNKSISLVSYSGYEVDAPNVYFPTKNEDRDKTYGYWIASTTPLNNTDLWYIERTGNIVSSSFDNLYLGARPIIYIPSTVTLTPDAETANLWNINY